MAEPKGLLVSVDTFITTETAERCLRIIEWYMNDRPGTMLCGEKIEDEDGNKKVALHFESIEDADIELV